VLRQGGAFFSGLMKRRLSEEGSWPAALKLELVVKSGDPDDSEFSY
jgi:hypothetical protein